MVIDFTATWCGPCKSMEPVIENYATIYADVQFIKIDVDILAVTLSFSSSSYRLVLQYALQIDFILL